MNREKQKEIIAFCEKYQMFQPGDGIVIGLSGGADSVYLTHFLDSIREQFALKLYAVHVHHGIRGAEADQDEACAKQCAERLGIPFERVRYEIPTLAKQRGMSEEEAGRYFRYQYFREVAERRGCQRIAVAHHRDDQAETVLFHLLRGSGLRGMGGIRPVQDDVIRPLLAVSRQDIEKELRTAGIGWQEDATNQDCHYARNKLRNQVIPFLCKEIQPEAVSHMAETAFQLQDAWEYLSRQAKREAECLTHWEPGRIWLERTAFLKLDPALQPYVLLHLMEELAGNRKDIGKAHIRAWMELIEGGTGRRISLPYHLQAGRDYEEIWLAKTEFGMGRGELQIPDELPGEVEIYHDFRKNLSDTIPKNHCTKWFDYAKIVVSFVWRHPKPGDYLVIDRQGHTKKLSRILLDQKIPREQRNVLWVLADGDHILWAPQIKRTSMGYYVTEETKEVLVVHIDGERWNTL